MNLFFKMENFGHFGGFFGVPRLDLDHVFLFDAYDF